MNLRRGGKQKEQINKREKEVSLVFFLINFELVQVK